MVSGKATTMELHKMGSLVVDPHSAHLHFAMMVTERLSTLEAKNDDASTHKV